MIGGIISACCWFVCFVAWFSGQFLFAVGENVREHIARLLVYAVDIYVSSRFLNFLFTRRLANEYNHDIACLIRGM